MPLKTFNNLTDDKKKRLIDAAAGEFSSRGYTGCSMQRIADRAGISKGSIYQYFKNKRELYLYIIDIALDTEIRHIKEIISQSDDLQYFELLEILLLRELRHAGGHLWMYRMYQTIKCDLPQDIRQVVNNKVYSLGQKHHEQLLKGALERGEINRNIHLELAGFVVYVIINEFGQYIAGNAPKMDEDQTREYVHQFLQILKNGIKGGE